MNEFRHVLELVSLFRTSYPHFDQKVRRDFYNDLFETPVFGLKDVMGWIARDEKLTQLIAI